MFTAGYYNRTAEMEPEDDKKEELRGVLEQLNLDISFDLDFDPQCPDLDLYIQE